MVKQLRALGAVDITIMGDTGLKVVFAGPPEVHHEAPTQQAVADYLDSQRLTADRHSPEPTIEDLVGFDPTDLSGRKE